jgi:hypothetical protein
MKQKYSPRWIYLSASNIQHILAYRNAETEHMVTFVPTADVAWAFIAQFDGNVPYHNNLYFLHTTGAPTHTELQTLADAMFGWHKDIIMPLIASDCQLSGVTCQMLDSLVGDFAVKFEIPNVSGGRTGSHVPLNCAARIDFITDDSTPAGQGNNRVSGIPLSVVTKERLDETWYQSLQAGYELVFERLPINWQWVVVSRHIAGADRDAGVTNPVVGVVRHDPIITSQRSRLLKSIH